MLRTNKTRIGSDTFHLEVAPGFVIDQEGVPLVAHVVGGKTYAKPCQGTGTEKFLGFSLSRSNAVDRAVTNKTVTVPAAAPYTVDLGVAIIATQFAAGVGGTALAEVATAPAAGEVKIDGTRLVFNAAQAGATVNVHAAYVPSYAQAVALQGSAPAGGLPSVAAGVIGIIRTGSVYTDRYDVNADWTNGGSSDPVAIKTGANGLLTIGGAGADISAAVTFLEAPSVGNGFLGVRAHG